MPRVTEEHLAARRQQILDAARACFLRKGFHHTSMQDVIAEAGLSVGAVYRYFKSKEEIIQAIATGVIGVITGRLAAIADHEPRLDIEAAMARALDIVDDEVGPGGAFPLALQVWAESLRNESLRGAISEAYSGGWESFARVARRAVDAGELPADTDPHAVGRLLFGLIPGYGLQRLMTSGLDRSTYLAGLHAVLRHTPRAVDTIA